MSTIPREPREGLGVGVVGGEDGDVVPAVEGPEGRQGLRLLAVGRGQGADAGGHVSYYNQTN